MDKIIILITFFLNFILFTSYCTSLMPEKIRRYCVIVNAIEVILVTHIFETPIIMYYIITALYFIHVVLRYFLNKNFELIEVLILALSMVYYMESWFHNF